ncbi:helix-turn-helix transcriptional regulator [Streptacidiphilus sp. P02-A3a]|uniref:ArsR/SmtB family transcription factor n=1 Tax=Streptacidiphilus sp. P02-A3a TaxID=2704468 RepID=UPI0015FBC9CD|nr:helix-turn-helix domain-containing protein [Streptacidiphilus sp. P02-A3a]QMU71838.1 helix-turn-helix transcriptional regulator [Streptacidiphilus sp. P02-A3a]
MIRLHVDDDSLQTTRLAFSPLWETIGSLGILARYRGATPSPYTNWARRVRDGMPAEFTRDLVDALRRPEPPLFPSGFVPVPDPARTTIEAELQHMRERHTGSAGANRRIALLERYWEWAIAPHWTSIRSSLEEEILFRGRTLAVGGVDAMLAELGGRVSWTPPYLTAPYHRDLDTGLNRTRLLLVPTVFAGGLRLFMEEDGVVAMSYQARATGYFHALTAPVRDSVAEDRLALLLGKGRAQVVRALEVPTTTTALADALGVAKSTVSQHLTVLNDAGIVWKQRLGGRVFYQLDSAGLALLRQLGL